MLRYHVLLTRISHQPSIHSNFNKTTGNPEAIGMTLVAIKSKIKGTANPAPEGADDVIDEALTLFRANVLFASFDIQVGFLSRLLSLSN